MRRVSSSISFYYVLRQGLSLNLELITDWTVSPRDLAVPALSVGVTDVYCETLLFCPWFWVHEFETPCLCGRNFVHGATSLALKGLLKALSFACGEWTIGSLWFRHQHQLGRLEYFPVTHWHSVCLRFVTQRVRLPSTVRLSPLSVSVSSLEDFYTSFVPTVQQQP